MNNKCVICSAKDPKWPTIDASTGFTFCDGCWREARKVFNRRGRVQDFGTWLESIAKVWRKAQYPFEPSPQ